MPNSPVSLLDLQAKSRRVNEAYAKHGFPSAEYHREFDELHDMRMTFMANKYRAEWGLPPDGKTPYD